MLMNASPSDQWRNGTPQLNSRLGLLVQGLILFCFVCGISTQTPTKTLVDTKISLVWKSFDIARFVKTSGSPWVLVFGQTIIIICLHACSYVKTV